MLIDLLPASISPSLALFFAAIILGLIFGFAAQRSQFCFRTAVLDPNSPVRATWVIALFTAALGMAAIHLFEVADLTSHRLFSREIPILALVVGGVLFGVGMVLSRGCASRLTILTATGNLRALIVLFCFAIVAHSTIKGILSQARASLNDVTVVLPSMSPSAAVWFGFGILFLLPLYLLTKPRVQTIRLLYGALIGLLVPASWLLTATLLADPFEPIAVQAVSFTQPLTDALFYLLASSALELSFGHGWVIGVLAGAFFAALVFKELAWQGFSSHQQMLRYLSGGALMGFGAAVAGGCTIGAVLAGVPALSVHGLIVLISIAAGAKLAHGFIQAAPLSGAQPNRQSQLPAE